MDDDTLDLEMLHSTIILAYNTMILLHGNLPPGTSSDSAHAIGEATGMLAKAKALVGRDIDDASRGPSQG